MLGDDRRARQCCFETIPLRPIEGLVGHRLGSGLTVKKTSQKAKGNFEPPDDHSSPSSI